MADDHNAQGPAMGVTPHLTIPSRGGQAAIEFYTRAFGAEEVRRQGLGRDDDEMVELLVLGQRGGQRGLFRPAAHPFIQPLQDAARVAQPHQLREHAVGSAFGNVQALGQGL